MNKLPDTLYKYTSADAALKILSTSQIRFSSPETFNDPFEVSPPVKITARNHKILEILKQEKITEEKLRDFLHKVCKYYCLNLKLFCLSKSKNNILMWSHYADMHKGVVIEFDTSKEIIKEAKKIIYEIRKINIDKIYETLKKENEDNNKDYKKIFYHKSNKWRYEQEYRCELPFTFNIDELKRFLQKEEQNTPLQQYVQIPGEGIKAVYLGCKISENDELAILNIIKSKYPNVKCYKAEKCLDAYKLKFKKINIQ